MYKTRSPVGADNERTVSRRFALSQVVSDHRDWTRATGTVFYSMLDKNYYSLKEFGIDNQVKQINVKKTLFLRPPAMKQVTRDAE